jgi:hypothetical protein
MRNIEFVRNTIEKYIRMIQNIWKGCKRSNNLRTKLLVFFILYIQGEYKVFPWLKTFIRQNICHVQISRFLNLTPYLNKLFFYQSQTSTCAPFVAQSISKWYWLLCHMFCSITAGTIAIASVIFAFRVVRLVTVNCTLYCSCSIKRSQAG